MPRRTHLDQLTTSQRKRRGRLKESRHGREDANRDALRGGARNISGAYRLSGANKVSRQGDQSARGASMSKTYGAGARK